MAVDMVAEEVALNLEEAAAATRKVSANGVGIFLGGLAVGVAVGFYLGYRWNREKIRAEAYAESKIEVEKIREAYRAGQSVVVEDTKPSLEEVIEDPLHVVERVRAIGMTCELDRAPDVVRARLLAKAVELFL